jgi:hypothetical protein
MAMPAVANTGSQKPSAVVVPVVEVADPWTLAQAPGRCPSGAAHFRFAACHRKSPVANEPFCESSVVFAQ